MALLKTYPNQTDKKIGKLADKIIQNGCINNFECLELEGTDLKVYGASIINEIDLDDLISGTVNDYKTKKYDEIDAKTQDLISQGFTFDNTLFSLSLPAQSNWNAIKSNKDTFNTLGLYPIQISTKDNDVYFLEEVDVLNFWIAGLTVIKSVYNAGQDLKKSVKQANTKADIDLIVDNR